MTITHVWMVKKKNFSFYSNICCFDWIKSSTKKMNQIFLFFLNDFWLDDWIRTMHDDKWSERKEMKNILSTSIYTNQPIHLSFSLISKTKKLFVVHLPEKNDSLFFFFFSGWSKRFLTFVLICCSPFVSPRIIIIFLLIFFLFVCIWWSSYLHLFSSERKKKRAKVERRNEKDFKLFLSPKFGYNSIFFGESFLYSLDV